MTIIEVEIQSAESPEITHEHHMTAWYELRNKQVVYVSAHFNRLLMRQLAWLLDIHGRLSNLRRAERRLTSILFPSDCFRIC